MSGDDRSSDAMLTEGMAQLTEGARAEARRDFWRHYWPRRVVPWLVAFTTVISVITGVVVANLIGLQSDTQAAVNALRMQAEQSKEVGDKANGELAQRGQPQVPIPTPGTAPDTDVIVAAATARVLASLPDSTPSTAALGQAVARYVAENPVTPAQPTPGQISSALAGYFATNPPPSGPPGATGAPGQNGANGADGQPGADGPPGRPPTAEEIEAAVGQYFAEHPEALCPRGGSIAQLRVQLADGGSADTWQCVVATYPAPTTPPILPIPTT
jgi:hypothetical protein